MRDAPGRRITKENLLKLIYYSFQHGNVVFLLSAMSMHEDKAEQRLTAFFSSMLISIITQCRSSIFGLSDAAEDFASLAHLPLSVLD